MGNNKSKVNTIFENAIDKLGIAITESWGNPQHTFEFINELQSKSISDKEISSMGYKLSDKCRLINPNYRVYYPGYGRIACVIKSKL